APAPAVVAAPAMVSKNEVEPLLHLAGRHIREISKSLLTLEVRLREFVTVDPDHTVPELQGVPGQSDDALDERDRRVPRVPKNNNVPALDRVETIKERVHDDPLAILEEGLHARSLDPESLCDKR